MRREHAQRIYRHTVLTHLEMQVRPSRKSRIAAKSQDLSLRHIIPSQHRWWAHEMPIARRVVIAVIDLDPIAESTAGIPAGEYNSARSGRSHGAARVEANVQSCMRQTDAEFRNAERLCDGAEDGPSYRAGQRRETDRWVAQ